MILNWEKKCLMATSGNLDFIFYRLYFQNKQRNKKRIFFWFVHGFFFILWGVMFEVLFNAADAKHGGKTTMVLLPTQRTNTHVVAHATGHCGWKTAKLLSCKHTKNAPSGNTRLSVDFCLIVIQTCACVCVYECKHLLCMHGWMCLDTYWLWLRASLCVWYLFLLHKDTATIFLYLCCVERKRSKFHF